MSTTICPARWNSASRSSTYAKHRWMSGDVASIPSLTRNGRPSFSLRSSSPVGSTSTAFRVRSATAIARSLVRSCLEVLDLHRLELVGRLEPEQLPREGQKRLQRAAHRVRAAEAMSLAFECDVGIGNVIALECGDDRLGLRRRHDLVVETLEEQQRARDSVRVRHG